LALSIRQPAVAGQFYPSDKDELYELIHRSFTNSIGPGKFPSGSQKPQEISRVECVIVPHAGYIYSGPVAAHSYKIAFDFFQKFKDEDRLVVFILGPNHYGIGSGVALSGVKRWHTPLGDISVATDFVKKLASDSRIVDIDDIAHSREHSIEVQIPFLQAMAGNMGDKVSVVPICLMLQDLETAGEVGDEVLSQIKQSNLPSLVIGSSDLTHYESHEKASLKDHAVLDEVTRLQILSFYNVLEIRNVTACGYGAIAAVMNISKKLGKREGTLLKYATSGETSGDKSSVVGYSAVHFLP